MKMKLRKSVLFLLSVTVLAPIVLYTDTLGTYFTSSSSRYEFLHGVPTLSFAGDARPLNLLPMESSVELKEPFGLIYSDNSTHYTPNDSDVASKENDLAIQLNAESTEEQYTDSSTLSISVNNNQSLGGNPIRQVTDTNEESVKQTPSIVGTSNEPEQIDVKKKLNSRNSLERKRRRYSSRTRGRSTDRENRKDVTENKNNEETVFSDAQIRQLKDQLIQAKVYTSLAATRSNTHFMRELRLRMKEVQRTLASATKDSDLPKNAPENLRAMEQTLLKGRQIQDDCPTLIKKLRAMIQSTEERIHVHKKQALFLTQLTAKTIPKGLHCLSLRLSTEYFMLNQSQQHFLDERKLYDPSMYHYAIFSDNILAVAVVINSTIIHAKDSSKHVFHIISDRLNYAAMRMWFLANPPGKATVEIRNVEELTWLNSSYSPVLKQLESSSMIEYYFKNRRTESDSNLKFRNPKYLSIMNHLRFYLPEIFPNLSKVLFLDDDIVVQKDLTGLWSLDLKGKVIGVVETCGESFHRFDRYLNFSNPLISKNFSPRACGWAYGMNIFDLTEWRKLNITEVYHRWQKLNHDRQLWKLGTLPPGLITFWNHTCALDKSWHVLGLGYNPNISQKDIEEAAVIHYNGNLKPWLEIGIPKFRNYWSRFVDYDHHFLRECNISP